MSTPRGAARVRVLVCGETNSDNLGDRVINDCLIYLLSEVQADVVVNSFDISMRALDAAMKPRSASWPRRLHRSLYARSHAYRLYLNRQIHLRMLIRYRESLAVALDGVDLVVVGGGQLLQDNALSFPLKLEAVVRACSEQGVPVVAFSVGVGTRWSRAGWRLFHQMIADPVVKSVYCRDRESVQFLRARLSLEAAAKVRTTLDVALLAGNAYKVTRADDGPTGVGVISPSAVMRVHHSHPLGSPRWSGIFYANICTSLLRRGERVEIFGNGSEEDQRSAAAVHESLVRKGLDRSAGLTLSARPFVASEFIGKIRSYRRMFAARLHANVVAESLGIPWIGFDWDGKVLAFARMVGKERCVMQLPRDARTLWDLSAPCLTRSDPMPNDRDAWEARLRRDLAEALERALA